MKNIFFNKSFNIIKKIKGCLICHNWYNKSNYPIINKREIKKTYNKLTKFKFYKSYNINMNFIISNLKNKYLLEISKFLNLIPKIKKIFVVKIDICDILK